MNCIEIKMDGRDLRIGVVASRFNEPIVDGLLTACLDELRRLGVADDAVTVVSVAGALEIPLVLATLAQKNFAALIALGAVVRGETYHFEIVSNEMAAGITRVQLDHGVPVANGVLTTEDDAQAFVRMSEKGRDCARVAVEMAQLLAHLSRTA